MKIHLLITVLLFLCSLSRAKEVNYYKNFDFINSIGIDKVPIDSIQLYKSELVLQSLRMDKYNFYDLFKVESDFNTYSVEYSIYKLFRLGKNTDSCFYYLTINDPPVYSNYTKYDSIVVSFSKQNIKSYYYDKDPFDNSKELTSVSTYNSQSYFLEQQTNFYNGNINLHVEMNYYVINPSDTTHIYELSNLLDTTIVFSRIDNYWALLSENTFEVEFKDPYFKSSKVNKMKVPRKKPFVNIENIETLFQYNYYYKYHTLFSGLYRAWLPIGYHEPRVVRHNSLFDKRTTILFNKLSAPFYTSIIPLEYYPLENCKNKSLTKEGINNYSFFIRSISF